MKLINSGISVSNIDKISCRHCQTRKSCLMRVFSDSEANNVEGLVTHEKPMRKGQNLFLQGDKFQSLYLVRSGSFKSCFTDETGERQVTGFHFSHDILGIDGIDPGRHILEVEALETSSVCTLPFQLFKEVSLRDNRGLYDELICNVSGMMSKANHLLMTLTKVRAEQRLASFLLDISQSMYERRQSPYEFKLPMARYDIANYLGLAVETVSRLFKRLEEQGLIVAQRHRLHIVDIDGLHSMATGAYLGSKVGYGEQLSCRSIG